VPSFLGYTHFQKVYTFLWCTYYEMLLKKIMDNDFLKGQTIGHDKQSNNNAKGRAHVVQRRGGVIGKRRLISPNLV
jgi:hypothetical protein